jgi:hypothetical protein
MKEILLARAISGQATAENIRLVTIEGWDPRDKRNEQIKAGALWLSAYICSYTSDAFFAPFQAALELLHHHLSLRDPKIEAQNQERLKIKEEILSGEFTGSLGDIYDRIEAVKPLIRGGRG